MSKKGMAIGIDLGTTYSCVGVIRPDGKGVYIIENSQGPRITPSCVSFDEDEMHIGEAAKEIMCTNAPNTVYEIKRIIGRQFNDKIVENCRELWPFEVVNDRNTLKVKVQYKNMVCMYTPEEISAMILKEMKMSAESHLGNIVTDAVITVPAYFNDSQRQATKDAGQIAGLNVLHIISEPVAAAIAYGLEKNIKNQQNILIYDLGGGTFDVAILSIVNEEFVVKAVGGDTHLGGSDFDEALVKHFVQLIKQRKNVDISTNKKSLAKLKVACEKAKRSLSSSEKSKIIANNLYNQNDFIQDITRSEFERICDKLFRYTINHVKGALAEANVTKADITDIVLVGGSTRIPKVQKLLQEFFNGKKLNKSMQPDEAVAYGAAVKAASSSGMYSMKEVELVDVTPLSLGIQSGDGKMVVSIRRNTPIPTSVTTTWTTAHENQSEVEFCLYAGEENMAINNHLLGSFCLSDIKKAKRGIPRIEVTFSADSDGIVNISALDTSTRRSNSITVRSDKGRLDKPQIERMTNKMKEINFA